MKISKNWLNDYVDIQDLGDEALAEALTSIGLEVDAIETGDVIDGNVVVGKVVEAGQHPNADSLRVCKVDTGAGELLDIVCGAPNARKDIYVAVATVGAVLPGDFKIKKTKIRGETSLGMMCSEKELGISDNHEQIIELESGLEVGKPIQSVLGNSDTVFEIGLTPNRADCNGYIGIARDLGAKLERPLKMPEHKTERSEGVASEGKVTIKISDQEGCARFSALRVEGVSVVESPAWIRQRLEASGMRPINTVVDVTNFVMLEYCQPIHAYDERDLGGATLEARQAKDGETLTTLDGAERKLQAGDIVIADGNRAVGLAGIMGGENSEVKDDTKNIVIEVAYFSPIQVRKTARRLGIHSEASHRFERGVDPSRTVEVCERVANLLVQVTNELNDNGAKLDVPRVAADIIDCYPTPFETKKVALRLTRTRQILAMPNLQQDEITGPLERLGLRLMDNNAERMVFEIPLWRHDIEREVDLIEEVGRLIGLDKIPFTLPRMEIRPTPEDPFIEFGDDVRKIVAGLGFAEAITFPFTSPADIAKMRVKEGHPLYPTLRLSNPLSEEHHLIQAHLLPGLLTSLTGNRRQGERGTRLFEVGRGYQDADKLKIDGKTMPTFRNFDAFGRHISTRAREDKGRPIERHFVAGIIDHPWVSKTWNTAESQSSFHHAKQVVVALSKAIGIAGLRFMPIQTEELPFLHPGAAALVVAGNETIGWCGELHPEAAFDLDFGANTAPILFELELERLFKVKLRGQKISTTINRFPPVNRDIAFLVDETTSHGNFEDAIKKFKQKKNLNRYDLFDVYKGEHIDSGKKSMAYTFYFQAQDKTLTDKEVDTEIKGLINWLGESLGAVQR